MKNSYLFDKFAIELVALYQQKLVNWVVIHIDMPIFSADTLDFLVTDIFLEEGIIHFFGNLSTGTDLAINFDLVKCITKNKYT